jgi:glycine/D-amino acid oxidase-like deaminating enzyme
MAKVFDTIVVGARCAGSPTAMLLARKGYRVLVVDLATFPGDTVSTHIVHPWARPGHGRARRRRCLSPRRKRLHNLFRMNRNIDPGPAWIASALRA